MLNTLAIILLLLAFAGALFWLLVWLHLTAILRNRPSARAGLAIDAASIDWPLLSVIVPAHNEGAIIARCVSTLLAQDYPKLEVIIVLDRCTDDSAEILAPLAAADPRLTVIENTHCPDDWAGKCHAASIGADRARGEWLLFTDADTQLDPALCRSTMAIAITGNLALLSLLSTLTYDHLWERIAQPVAAINLMRMHPIHRVNRDRDTKDFANGQFLLFDRRWYDKLGGHHAVRSSLLEDIDFARHVRGHGGRARIAFADRMLICSMYDTFSAFRQGWKRIFIEVSRSKVSSLRRSGVRIMIAGIGLALVHCAGIATALMLIADSSPSRGLVLLGTVFLGMLLQYSALAIMYRLSGAPLSAVWMYPAGCMIVGMILLEAASDLLNRRPVRWGGREYVLEPYRPAHKTSKYKA